MLEQTDSGTVVSDACCDTRFKRDEVRREGLRIFSRELGNLLPMFSKLTDGQIDSTTRFLLPRLTIRNPRLINDFILVRLAEEESEFSPRTLAWGIQNNEPLAHLQA